MEMNNEIIKKLQEPLDIKDVEFRAQSVSAKGYITLLAYKDSRVDQNRLDEAVGAMNWQRAHTRENHNCIVSIWDDEKKQWISKEDTGAESFSEKEKGLASDSFKRACFNWGIGRELYDYPFIFLQLYPNEFKVENNKAKTTFDFNLKKWRWEMTNVKGNITLKGFDNKGRLRYDSTKDFNGIPKGSTTKVEPTPTKVVAKSETKKAPLKDLVKDSEDWKVITKSIEEGLLKKLSQITKYKVSDALAKDIEELINEKIFNDATKE